MMIGIIGKYYGYNYEELHLTKRTLKATLW